MHVKTFVVLCALLMQIISSFLLGGTPELNSSNGVLNRYEYMVSTEKIVAILVKGNLHYSPLAQMNGPS